MIHLHLKRPEESSGGEQSCSREREGGQDRGKDTEMKSSGDLLCISSPRVGAEANQSSLLASLPQPSEGLPVSLSLSLGRLKFLSVRLGQQSRGNRFLSPSTPPSAQTAQLRCELS